jgi:hypothetical protein
MIMIVASIVAMSLGAVPLPDYRCNYAKIRRASQAVPVYANHRRGAKIVARLRSGAVVYTCDEYRNSDGTDRWTKVMFGVPKRPCRGDDTGLPSRLASACLSGWVKERNVEILSG